MKSLIEVIQAGGILNKNQKTLLGQMMDEFKSTEIYKILKIANENAIKDLLTAGKDKDETAERRLGKMEGIQEAFENRVEEIIREGEAELRDKKLMKKYKKEMKEDDKKDMEDLTPDKGDVGV